MLQVCKLLSSGHWPDKVRDTAPQQQLPSATDCWKGRTMLLQLSCSRLVLGSSSGWNQGPGSQGVFCLLTTFREVVTFHISPLVPKIQFGKNYPKLGHWESHLGCPGLCCGLDGHLTTDPLAEVVSAARSQAGCTR